MKNELIALDYRVSNTSQLLLQTGQNLFSVMPAFIFKKLDVAEAITTTVRRLTFAQASLEAVLRTTSYLAALHRIKLNSARKPLPGTAAFEGNLASIKGQMAELAVATCVAAQDCALLLNKHELFYTIHREILNAVDLSQLADNSMQQAVVFLAGSPSKNLH